MASVLDLVESVKDDQETVQKTIARLELYNKIENAKSKDIVAKDLIKRNTCLEDAIELGLETICELSEERDYYKNQCEEKDALLRQNNIIDEKNISNFNNAYRKPRTNKETIEKALKEMQKTKKKYYSMVKN